MRPDKKTKFPPQSTILPKGIVEFDFEGQKKSGSIKSFTPEAKPGDPGYNSQAGLSSTANTAPNGKRRVYPPDRFLSEKDSSRHAEALAHKPSTPLTSMPTLSPPPTISDFRKNVDRQKREQQSVATFLSTVVYCLLGGVLLIAVLAGFGGYNLWKRINNQAVTVAQLEAKYDQQVAGLKDELEQAKKVIADQTVLNQQQRERIGKMALTIEKTSAALREEKDARAREVVGLRKRLQQLEGRRSVQNE